MALSLNDVLAAPSDPNELNQHLLANGLVPTPAPKPVIPSIAPFSGPSSVADKLALGVTAQPVRPKATIEPMPAAPEVAAPASSAMIPPLSPEKGAIPALNVKEQMALPTSSAAVAPGSSTYFANQVAREDLAKQNPWGSMENHPGLIGKIGHGLAKAGNIALDVVAPGIAALVPGTDLNKEIERKQNLGQEAQALGREQSAKVEEERERHAETTEDQNQVKLDQAEQKIDEEHQKNLNSREAALRKQGLKPDPANPNGPPVPISYEDMSPTEQAVYDVKSAQAGAAEAKAALDKIKADPGSPQNQATLERIRVMAQNAATAAGKLGLDKDKFMADYFGLDKDGNPIAGTQVTPEGKPVGPKVAGTTQHGLSELNKNYVKPAEDVEKSYSMMDNAYQEYKAAKAKGQELPTGAQAMVALSTHLATTFGNVKGARITRDMIQHHLGARSISDDALVAIQKLTNGDPLSPGQWDAFHDLIKQSRDLSWKTAAKEARRANLPVDFLPADLAGNAPAPNAAPAAAPAAGGGGGVPTFSDWKKKKGQGTNP